MKGEKRNPKHETKDVNWLNGEWLTRIFQSHRAHREHRELNGLYQITYNIWHDFVCFSAKDSV
jgi:hypothetical protein